MDRNNIEATFEGFVESAKKQFNGEKVFNGQDLLKGKILPAKGITELDNGILELNWINIIIGKILLDIVVVETLADGEKLGKTKFEIISAPDEDDELTKEAVIWAFEEKKFKEVERDNWQKIASKHEKKMFKATFTFA